MKEFKSNTQLRKAVNETICGKANGFFHDDFWAGKTLITNALDMAGFEYLIEDSKYSQDENGNLTGKTWYLTVIAGKRAVKGVIIASFCGNNDDPTGRYDMCAYCA